MHSIVKMTQVSIVTAYKDLEPDIYLRILDVQSVARKLRESVLRPTTPQFLYAPEAVQPLNETTTQSFNEFSDEGLRGSELP